MDLSMLEMFSGNSESFLLLVIIIIGGGGAGIKRATWYVGKQMERQESRDARMLKLDREKHKDLIDSFEKSTQKTLEAVNKIYPLVLSNGQKIEVITKDIDDVKFYIKKNNENTR